MSARISAPQRRASWACSDRWAGLDLDTAIRLRCRQTHNAAPAEYVGCGGIGLRTGHLKFPQRQLVGKGVPRFDDSSVTVHESRSSLFCWFGFDSADRQVFPRLPTIPQHDRVGFVGGDAQDHAAPTVQSTCPRAFVERGCDACDELYPVPLLDLQSSVLQTQRRASRISWLGGVAHSLIRCALKIRERPEAVSAPWRPREPPWCVPRSWCAPARRPPRKEHERVGVRDLGDDERDTLRHQAGDERHVARQPVELGRSPTGVVARSSPAPA